MVDDAKYLAVANIIVWLTLVTTALVLQVCLGGWALVLPGLAIICHVMIVLSFRGERRCCEISIGGDSGQRRYANEGVTNLITAR